jgi:hypothetical protein
VGDVIVGGVAPPPGDTIWQQSRFIAQDETLRNFVLNEPRGGVFRHDNLLVPPKDPRARMGWIVMEPADTPPMSGSNSICVATVLLDTGIVPMVEPETRFALEAPGGLVEITAECRDGKAERITVRNVASFADKLDAKLQVAGLGTLTVDTAYGGDSFVLVGARARWLAVALFGDVVARHSAPPCGAAREGIAEGRRPLFRSLDHRVGVPLPYRAGGPRRRPPDVVPSLGRGGSPAHQHMLDDDRGPPVSPFRHVAVSRAATRRSETPNASTPKIRSSIRTQEASRRASSSQAAPISAPARSRHGASDSVAISTGTAAQWSTSRAARMCWSVRSSSRRRIPRVRRASSSSTT